MKTINVTTKQLFDNFISNLSDMVWDEPAFADGYQVNNLKVIAEENMEAIRSLFKDGLTFASWVRLTWKPLTRITTPASNGKSGCSTASTSSSVLSLTARSFTEGWGTTPYP